MWYDSTCAITSFVDIGMYFYGYNTQFYMQLLLKVGYMVGQTFCSAPELIHTNMLRSKNVATHKPERHMRRRSLGIDIHQVNHTEHV